MSSVLFGTPTGSGVVTLSATLTWARERRGGGQGFYNCALIFRLI